MVYTSSWNLKYFAENLNITETWIREDYQEMNELLIIFFGGRVQRRDANGLLYNHTWKMQRPGAVSHARFMSKAIYMMKIFATSSTPPQYTFS